MATGHALSHQDLGTSFGGDTLQLALSKSWMARLRAELAKARARQDAEAPLCTGCREREARYGFADEAHPAVDRPRTLCFSCFRVEMTRRQSVADRMARGWNAEQVALPLQQTLDELTRRRRRAQIAARRALGA